MSKDSEVFEELALVDIKQRYGGTPEGQAYINDIIKSQKGQRHPDAKAWILTIAHMYL